MQYDKREILHSYIYYFKKNNLTKCNYEIYNKEMLIIVQYLKE